MKTKPCSEKGKEIMSNSSKKLLSVIECLNNFTVITQIARLLTKKHINDISFRLNSTELQTAY